jgi:hypothetical protein
MIKGGNPPNSPRGRAFMSRLRHAVITRPGSLLRNMGNKIKTFDKKARDFGGKLVKAATPVRSPRQVCEDLFKYLQTEKLKFKDIYKKSEFKFMDYFEYSIPDDEEKVLYSTNPPTFFIFSNVNKLYISLNNPIPI